MKPRDSVSAILGHDDRLVVLPVPRDGLVLHVRGNVRQRARVRVPTVVAVEAYHV